MLRMLSGYWQWMILPFGGTTSESTQEQQYTPMQIEGQKLALQEVQRNAELQKILGPAQKQAIQDMVDEASVRSGGKVTDIMRDGAVDTAATEARQKKYEDQLARETTAQQRSDRQAEIGAQISEMQLADLKRGGAASPEQLALIGEATAAAQKTGEADIERFRTDTLRQINEEIAAASGLRPTDTPVVRLSERAGEESARQQGQLTSRLAETNAMARLNFPMAQSKLLSDAGSVQQELGMAAQSFQAQLNERAKENRFRLFASPTSLGAGGSSLGLGSPNVRQETEKDPTFTELSNFAGGVGAMIFSDRRLKRDIFQLGALASGIPVFIFRFEGFEDWHIGVMADEVMGVVPEAVIEDESGYKKVNYSLLH